MNVRLIDVDSKIPNLALMKLSEYHKKIGDIVGWGVEDPDLVYISCIFSKNKSQALGIRTMFPKAKVVLGGTGIDLTTTTPDDLIKPDYELYPSTYSQGFTTRGCIRNCGFCVVPKKEGKIRIVQHPKEFHNDKFDSCYIMDNNILAAPNKWWKEVFNWFSDNNIKMIEKQGMDIRLLNEDMARGLREVKLASNIHFAWDNIKDEKYVVRGLEILKNVGFNLRSEIQLFVLCNFNSTHEEDLYRCNKLKEMGTNPFVMVYNREKAPKITKNLQRWANRKWLFWSIPFEEYR